MENGGAPTNTTHGKNRGHASNCGRGVAPQVACKASCGGTEPHAMGAGHGEKRASSARQGAAPLPPSLQLTQAKLSTPKKTQHQNFSAKRNRGTRPSAERITRPAPVRGLIQGSIRRAASVETPGRRLAAVLAGPPPWDPGGACCASHRRRSARGSSPRSRGECGRKMSARKIGVHDITRKRGSTKTHM